MRRCPGDAEAGRDENLPAADPRGLANLRQQSLGDGLDFLATGAGPGAETTNSSPPTRAAMPHGSTQPGQHSLGDLPGAVGQCRAQLCSEGALPL
jgi:hypothetical protein